MTSKEFRTSQKLTNKELKLLEEHINRNMAKYDSNISLRMEMSDKAEKRMNRFNSFEDIEL